MWRAFAFITLLTLCVTGATCTRKEAREAATAAPPESGAAKGKISPPEQVAAEDDLFLDLDVEPDYEGPPPLNVRFILEVEDAVAPIKYEWDFGDGSAKSHDASPTHVFQKEGEYTTVVTVTDSRGVSATEDIDIYVEKD